MAAAHARVAAAAAAAAFTATRAATAHFVLAPHPRWPRAAICEERSRLEMVTKDKFLRGKLADSTTYSEMGGGMRACDLKIGSGKEATRGVLVGVHFDGFRLNGRSLESSWSKSPVPLFIEAGNTPEFPGLGEGVVGMREGGRRELIIPPSMNRADTEEVTTYTVELYVVSSTEGTATETGGNTVSGENVKCQSSDGPEDLSIGPEAQLARRPAWLWRWIGRG